MSKILLPDGVYLGHADDGERTGVSVILAPKGMTGGVSVRGCAPGTRETDLLRPEKTIDKVYAVALCGGSAFGLSACDGVMRYCREKNIGHDVGGVKVPLVAAAVIFDLNDGIFAYPDAETGYCACLGAKNHDLLFGSVGAGTGAVLGKILGKAFSQKSGMSFLKITLEAEDPEVVEAIAREFPELDMLRYSGENLYRFADLEAEKWKALKTAAGHLGISTEDIAAFGDDTIDIEMLKNCGVGVAVENALETVKAAANQICPSNDSDGVARWLEENLLLAQK